jgi:hypothetical protein
VDVAVVVGVGALTTGVIDVPDETVTGGVALGPRGVA